MLDSDQTHEQMLNVKKEELKNYLVFLKSTAGLNSEAIDKIMPELEFEFLKGGKGAVNKLIFSIDGLKADKKEVVVAPDMVKSLAAALKSISENKKHSKIASANNDIESMLRNIRDYHQSINTYLDRISDQRALIESLTGVEQTTQSVQTLLETLAAKGFEITSVVSSQLLLLTPEIVLSYFNTKAQVNMALSMGQYTISVDLNNLQLFVKPGKNNITWLGYCHPHVGDRGSICWGNAANAFDRAVKSRDILLLVETAYSVLKEYNAESPYQTIENFYVAKHPEVLRGRPISWIKWRGAIEMEVNDENFPVMPHDSDISYDYSDDEGDPRITFYPWYAVYQGTSIRATNENGEERHAIRAGNNRYVEPSAEVIEEWNNR